MVDKNKFKGSDWKKYSEFEFIWVEKILTKKIIQRDDLIFLLKKFSIKFTKPDWENEISDEDIGNVLIADISKEKLLPEIEDLWKNKFPDRVSIDEMKIISNTLLNYNTDILVNLYNSISKNERLKTLINENYKNSSDIKIFLINLIIEEFCKLDKKEVQNILDKIR